MLLRRGRKRGLTGALQLPLPNSGLTSKRALPEVDGLACWTTATGMAGRGTTAVAIVGGVNGGGSGMIMSA